MPIEETHIVVRGSKATINVKTVEPGVDRLRVQIKATYNTGSRMEFNAATHHSAATRRCEADKVMLATLEQLMVMAAVAKMDRRVWHAKIDAVYDKMEGDRDAAA
jgi:hypothetical protein